MRWFGIATVAIGVIGINIVTGSPLTGIMVVVICIGHSALMAYHKTARITEVIDEN